MTPYERGRCHAWITRYIRPSETVNHIHTSVGHPEPRLSALELNLVHKIVTRIVSEDNDEDTIDQVIVFFMLKFIPEYMKQTLGQTFDTLTAYERLELDDTDIPEFSAP